MPVYVDAVPGYVALEERGFPYGYELGKTRNAALQARLTPSYGARLVMFEDTYDLLTALGYRMERPFLLGRQPPLPDQYHAGWAIWVTKTRNIGLLKDPLRMLL